LGQLQDKVISVSTKEISISTENSILNLATIFFEIGNISLESEALQFGTEPFLPETTVFFETGTFSLQTRTVQFKQEPSPSKLECFHLKQKRSR